MAKKLVTIRVPGTVKYTPPTKAAPPKITIQPSPPKPKGA